MGQILAWRFKKNGTGTSEDSSLLEVKNGTDSCEGASRFWNFENRNRSGGAGVALW